MTNPCSQTPGGPIGKRIVQAARENETANAALVWERYFPIWQEDENPPKCFGGHDSEQSQGRAPVPRFAEWWNDRHNQRHNGAALMSARVHRALETYCNKRNLVLKTSLFRVVWRFVTGLGRDHPTDNGFAFHAPSGSPFIPGSTVKGLCRQAATILHEDNGHPSVEALHQAFGPERIFDTQKTQRGSVRFFDAFPASPIQLTADIINCHHPLYYVLQNTNIKRSRSNPADPTETESPVPVLFLCVERQSEFEFPIVATDTREADEVLNWLEFGLDFLGIGAKTSAGYGFLERDR